MARSQPVENVRRTVNSLLKAGTAGEQGLKNLQMTTLMDLVAVGIIKEDKTEKPDYFDEHKRLLREHAHMTRLAAYSRAQGDMSLTRPSDLFGGAFGRMI